MSTTTTEVVGGQKVRRTKRRVEPIYYLFLLPSLILLTLAITIPGIIGIFFSFTDSIGIGDWSFIGLTNYVAAFSDPAILQSYLFTFGFSIATVLVVNAIAFMLAVGLVSRIRFKTGLRTIFVIPMVISASSSPTSSTSCSPTRSPPWGRRSGSRRWRPACSPTPTWRGSPSSP